MYKRLRSLINTTVFSTGYLCVSDGDHSMKKIPKPDSLSGIIELIVYGPILLVKELALKIVFLPRATIESILLVAIGLALAEILIDSGLRFLMGSFSLFSGTMPLAIRLVGLLVLIALYFVYELYPFKIYKNSSVIEIKKKQDKENSAKMCKDAESSVEMQKDVESSVKMCKDTESYVEVKKDEDEPQEMVNIDDLMPTLDLLDDTDNGSEAMTIDVSSALESLMSKSEKQDNQESEELVADPIEGDNLSFDAFPPLFNLVNSTKKVPEMIANNRNIRPDLDIETISKIEQQINSPNNLLNDDFIITATKKIGEQNYDYSGIMQQYKVKDYFAKYA